MTRPPLLMALAALACVGLALAAPGVAAPARPTPVAVTGWYGPATTAAVKRYQALHQLPVTGIADRKTLWSLGLVVAGPLYPGTSGAGVRALQRALRHHERVGVTPRPPRPNPGRVPAPRRTAAPSPWPVFELPSPGPMPSAPPEPLATPVAVAPPPPASGAARPMVELFGGGWLAPVPPGGPPWLFGGGGALWLGDVGLGGEYTLAPDLGGQVPGDLIDVQLRYRGLGPVWVGLGYRGIAGENLGAGTLGLDLPLGLDWLVLRLAAGGGTAFGPGYVADGRGALALAFGPVWVEGGYRALAMDGLGGLSASGLAHGPTFGAGLRF